MNKEPSFFIRVTQSSSSSNSIDNNYSKEHIGEKRSQRKKITDASLSTHDGAIKMILHMYIYHFPSATNKDTIFHFQ